MEGHRFIVLLTLMLHSTPYQKWMNLIWSGEKYVSEKYSTEVLRPEEED